MGSYAVTTPKAFGVYLLGDEKPLKRLELTQASLTPR
jgi:hypothetical protein